jgi:glycosyltransferase involved in cell wall biosynthesis
MAYATFEGASFMTVSVVHIATVDRSLYSLLINQLLSLQQAGYEVETISSAGPYVEKLMRAGIRHTAVPMERDASPMHDLVTLWRLVRVMRQKKFTIVHTHNPKPGLLGQVAARLVGTPVIVNTVHGFYFHEHMSPARRRFYIALEKIAGRCSDSILSQNKEDVQAAIQEGIAPPGKIQHLGNGIDLATFCADRFGAEQRQQKRTELSIPADAQIVGFVGRLAAKRKGFLDFLEAGKRVVARMPSARLMIVGQSDVEKPDAVHPSVARDYGIEEYCHFLGLRQMGEMPSLYALMDVLVLPSLFEGVPRAIMEASAMSVPVVATNVKGNRDAVDPGRNGVLVPLGDVQALADAIVQVLSDRATASRMGQEGRQLALERFDEQLVFARVKAEYERLLRAKSLPVPAVSVGG